MRNIILTGGNDGIGLEMIKQFLQDGDRVAVLDISGSNLAPLVNDNPGKLLFFQCDIRDGALVEKCVNETLAVWGALDYAIHNACKCTFLGFMETEEATCREVFDVNYYGAVHLAKAVIPGMQKRHAGSVFFTSSGVGVMGFPRISPYASSKGALEALAKCLQLEYQADGISFHILHPPLTRTVSARPLPVPEAFKADPKAVGQGLAKNITRKQFIICPSFGQAVQTKMTYVFSISLGKLMSDKLDKLAQK